MSSSSDNPAKTASCGARPPRLVLDHLTAVEAPPDKLAELAAGAGFAAFAPFLHAMPGTLPLPDYDLVQDTECRRSLRCHLRELGVAIDLAYPVTLAQHTEADQYQPALFAAADLGARAVNVLCYDRDPVRTQDQICRLVELARNHDLAVAIEFYPVSRIRDFATAFALAEAAGSPAEVGITLDLLHLYRSGSKLADLERHHWERVHFLQLCDGVASRERAELDYEAAFDRLLPGEGSFDFAPLADLNLTIPVTLEIPREAARVAGETAVERVRRAMTATSDVLANAMAGR